MKRSLQTRLFWGHACFFLIASIITILITWDELEHRHHPGTAQAWRALYTAALVACAPVLLIASASWWLTRRALSPVIDLTRAAEHIHEDSLHQNIPLRGTGDEIDRLTSVLNDMTSRLDTSFQRVREFTLHASHELKTPLTILRNGFETSLSDPTLTPSHRDKLCLWLDETDRLNRIVSGLTFLTQADAQQIELNFETVDLAELVRDTANEANILGQSQNIAVNTLINSPHILQADRHRLRQLLLNLTDNAIKYNRPNGYVTYRIREDAVHHHVDVQSGGRGIDAEELPKIFDRFFRSGTSRGTSTEGCGLGLSIALWIAQSHGGTLTARSSPDNTTLTLSLKRSNASPNPSSP
ncbi:HAMP domain-containing protein [Phragmitibacter flavus]|uniref:histidine kinase n=1 Tax=Phragmitibacter flavus TaxID=2576071 RepID=A0A5R8KDX9_9BACT|nr:ATP-binding protein [Phragmitibacter flavus]TLD70508.1 HAMP domain-containing protein [Phragmitibacter flavus]